MVPLQMWQGHRLTSGRSMAPPILTEAGSAQVPMLVVPEEEARGAEGQSLVAAHGRGRRRDDAQLLLNGLPMCSVRFWMGPLPVACAETTKPMKATMARLGRDA